MDVKLLRILICILTVWSMTLSAPANAQDNSLFETVARVNDGVVTRFELEQRVLMLEALGTGGDITEIALKNLIDERLYIQAANQLGIQVTQEEIDRGIEEFAGRGNVGKDELLEFLNDNGVEEISFRAFVDAGLKWRAVVNSRFGRKAAVQDDEIENSLNLGASQTQLSLLLSEIILPLQERGEVETRRLAEELSDTIKGSGDFATAASRYSSAPSAQRDGRLDWTSASKIAPSIMTQIMALDPGQVTPPIEFPNFIGLFLLRGVRTERVENPLPVSLNYVLVNLPPVSDSAAEASKLLGRVDTCMDLRAVAEKYGAAATSEATVLASAAPEPVATELAKLDRNEAIAFTNAAGQRSVVMLCNRIRELPEESRDGVRQAMFSERISGFGDSYLQELKGQAFIELK
jgi:peptidyl-prolyl cis-trans isomerase SurA